MSKTINLIIGVLIGVVFLGIMANSLFGTTNLTGNEVTEELLTSALANGTTYTLTYDDLITGTAIFTNGSDTLSASNYTLDLSAGTLYFGDDGDLTYEGNPLYVNYSYYPDTYVQGGTSRLIITLIMVFVAIGFVIGILRKTGTSK